MLSEDEGLVLRAVEAFNDTEEVRNQSSQPETSRAAEEVRTVPKHST